MSESKQEKNQYTSAVFSNSLPSDFFTDSLVAEGVRLITDHGGIFAFEPSAQNMTLESLDKLIKGLDAEIQKHIADNKHTKSYLAYRAYRKAMEA